MSKYRLKKDWLAAGEHYLILRAGLEFEECGPFYIHKGSKYQFLKSVVEKETDWFEEVKPERIEVDGIFFKTLTKYNRDNQLTGKEFWMYCFLTNKGLPESEFPAIKQAIEKVLNNEEGDESGYLKMQQQWIDEFILELWKLDIRMNPQSNSLTVLLPNLIQVIKHLVGEYDGKKYTEKDMEDCWHASRRAVFPYAYGHTMAFKDYLQSLNKAQNGEEFFK